MNQDVFYATRLDSGSRAVVLDGSKAVLSPVTLSGTPAVPRVVASTPPHIAGRHRRGEERQHQIYKTHKTFLSAAGWAGVEKSARINSPAYKKENGLCAQKWGTRSNSKKRGARRAPLLFWLRSGAGARHVCFPRLRAGWGRRGTGGQGGKGAKGYGGVAMETETKTDRPKTNQTKNSALI